jgi:amino acid adenylation domain-containing protein
MAGSRGDRAQKFVRLNDANNFNRIHVSSSRNKVSMISSHGPSPSNPFVEFRLADIHQTIAQRFEQEARRYPERLAVKAGVRALTYDELNAAATGVARAILKRIEVQMDQVAILCDTGVSMVVAILGAAKAGKAFAPLDPRLPRIRLQEIFATLDNCLVLSDENNFAAAAELADRGRIVNVDVVSQPRSRENLEMPVAPDALAYINFTSGSTGAPKGVMWNHRSELFGIRTKTNALHIAPADRISLLRANNVGALRDMLLALLNGAALIVLDLSAGEVARLGDWLREEEITVFTCVASVFRQSINDGGRALKFPAVRLIHIGGEPIFKADVEHYRQHFSDDCLLVSRYSISETQAISYFFLNKQTEVRGERVPAGYPLDGNEVFILDDAGNEASAGTTGEIAVRSPYLSLGYWRQPELTGARFLDGFQGAGTRTYLTGDLGYQLPDGCLMHAGRKDFQAKVKGYRVEVGAVEAALNEIPSVRQAVVVAQPDRVKGSRLIAYVVPKKEAAVDIDQLIRRLKAKLPAYMMPNSFSVLESLPLNSAGKVDRRALPAPEKKRRERTTELAAPRNALERVLAKFWRDAFDLELVSVDDDFTQFGADSLLAAQVAAKIAGLFPLTEPLANPFQTPTIAATAAFILAHEPEAGQSEIIAARFLQIEAMSDAEVFRALQTGKGSEGDV